MKTPIYSEQADLEIKAHIQKFTSDLPDSSLKNLIGEFLKKNDSSAKFLEYLIISKLATEACLRENKDFAKMYFALMNVK